MNKLDRQKEIHSKGFGMGNSLEFGRMKVGKKTLDDAALDLSILKSANRNFNNKEAIIKALANKDIPTLREISNYFYRTSGIYFRICNYFAQMYRYDWYIVDETYEEVDTKKVTKDFYKALSFLDNSCIRKTCMDIALRVIRDGAYYGCVVPSTTGIVF